MAESGSDIALVVLDALRKDAFDAHFSWMDGVRYENAWSTTHYSPAAHGSLFTGKYGSEIGVHAKSPTLDCDQPTLAELLRDSGYETHGFSANTYISKYFDFDRGFDEFHSRTRVVGGNETAFNWPQFIKENKDAGWRKYPRLMREIARSDAKLLSSIKNGAEIKLKDIGLIDDDNTYEDGREALNYIQAASFASDHEFVFLNLMDAHGPYLAPPSYRTKEPERTLPPATFSDAEDDVDSEALKTAYEDCVRYLSDIYAEIHEELLTEFDYVITLADHGEAFGEYGTWSHSDLSPQVTNVPLAISSEDGLEEFSPTGKPVNLHDVFQTVLDLAGVEPETSTRGQSLRAAKFDADRVAFLETHGLSNERLNGILEEEHSQEIVDKYDKRLSAIATASGYVFEQFGETIESVGDPVPDAERRMQELAAGIDRRTDAKAVEVSDEVYEQLEELGYT
ncbi:conserved hypothetical protein [Halobacterium salinarum NRC-1]|uniref:AlkP-core domain protein n=3 Tax=Halobacterium salinarum TaxID=2242 RepID=Q9HQQ2_HALSA|nr:sulfatase [Halobacterium salinarum]AAG19461.1 conserved hypothetical protein [Halobacterium salinarum NRC-1]MBB6090145.1 arylsulfatase A-like enzyme [Halobacterium salinarum]UEB92885.1 sulfatase [Halobacterium salinarum NRC-34001]CAP13737.1 AlkP-core domain protein [Halobacterium salinarum R1]DAC78174.1 TPA_inf: AlkP-core domain protein [Halobacterium salinarum NRC-1]